LQAAFKGNLLEATSATKARLVTRFEELLAEEVVSLGTSDQELENWDEERRPIDTIVLHHTSREPGLKRETLSAMHLLRLYVPRYQSQDTPVLNADGSRQPVYSGHFDTSSKQVFYAYHWLIRSDGEAERLLKDTETGWHAGDWDINCRSVAICIDDDLTSKKPSSAVIAGVIEVISRNYPDITIHPETLLGHGEVSDTICPGNEFIGGWKLELLKKLS
jgi:N-acetyl-anhydromuramyl-L-alanine amidase AmpD